MTHRIVKKTLLKDIQKCIEKDEDKYNRIKELRSQISELNSRISCIENEKVWVGMPQIYKALGSEFTYCQNYDKVVRLCGTHKIPNVKVVLELVIDFLNDKIKTNLSFGTRQMYKDNIELIEKYIENGCPMYVPPSPFVIVGTKNCAIGNN